MQLSKGNLAILVVFSISWINTAVAQSAEDQFQPIVEISAHRLLIAQQVALAKWDSGAAVEDPPREAQVIQGAVKSGDSKGLDPALVSNFFKAQIEANKVVQYSLLADWHRAGKAPHHEPVNLSTTMRPQLDKVQTELVAELARTAAIRASPTCRTNVAKAVGHYLSSHQYDDAHLFAIALDRALSTACAP